MSLIDDVFQDIGSVLRDLRRRPGVLTGVVTILALAVGANTAVVSVLNAVALRELPVHAPSRLVVLTPTDSEGRQSRLIHHGDVSELSKLPVFDTLGLYSGGGILWIEARGATGEGAIEAVAPGFHEALGLRPFLGRFFDLTDGSGAGAANAVTVISHRFWQRYYGSDPAVIGERLLINAVPFTIVGVTPPEYRGLYIEIGVDFSVPGGVLGRQLPTNQFPTAPASPLRGVNAVGYLRPGATLEQARAAVDATWRNLRRHSSPVGLSSTEQADLRTQRIKVASLSTGFSNLGTRNRDLLNILSGAAFVLLAIAGVNLMGLLLARIAAREQEWFVHISLGATSARLARKILIEGMVWSVLGTAAGVLVAWWAAQALTLLLWDGATSLTLSVTPDLRVLLLAAVAAIAIALVISALPGWMTHRRAALPTVRAVTPATARWSKALLVVQVALTLVLLFVAGLFTSSLSRLRHLDSGVRSEGIRWTRVLPRPGGYRDINERTYYPELVRRLAAVPGVDAVALSHHFPAYFNFGSLVTEYPIARVGVVDRVEAAQGMMEFVSPGFFETIGTPPRRGRDFAWSDDLRNTPVAVVNEALSRRLFPGGNALGAHIRIGDDPARGTIEIVGVVPDATIGSYRANHQPVAFRPKAQEPRFMRSPVVVLRSRLPAAAIDRAVTTTVSSLGREYVRRMYSLEEQVDRTLNRERLMTWVSSVFGGLAALAAAVGLFSLLTHSVVRRTREFGVRMAVGASRASIMALVLRDGLTLILTGVAIGVPGAWASRRLAEAMLFGISSSDAWTLGAAILLVVSVGMAACLWPAVRASKVAPVVALRCE